MAERNPCLWLQNRIDHTAENDRAVLTALLAGREGVFGEDDLKVTQRGAGANMSVDVAGGRAAVNGDDAAITQGSYLVWNDATKNLTIAAADPTNPRKDIIIARVYDAFYSGSSNEWALEVITGTPASTPSEPAVPNNAIKLAVVTVPALASSITNAHIADVRQRAAAVGGTIVCTSTTRPTSPHAGQEIYEANTGLRLYWNGSAWRYVPGQVLASAERTTNQNGVASGTDFAGLSVTFDALGGPVLVKARLNLQNTGSSETILFNLKEGSSTVESPMSQALHPSTGLVTHYAEVRVTPSAGSHTYKLTHAGLNNVNLLASSSRRAQLVVVSA